MRIKIEASTLLRYAIVGATANGVTYLVYLLMTSLGMGAKTSMSILYATCTLISFIGNKQWAFASQSSRWTSSFARYVLVHCVGYGINFFLLLAFSDWMNYPHQWIQAVAIFVVAAYLFVALRYFVFPEQPRSAPASDTARL